jgi:transposase
MREMSVTEQRYQAVLAVITEGWAVFEVASQWGVSRRTVHRWLARYEAEGWKVYPTAPIGHSGILARCPLRSKVAK